MPKSKTEYLRKYRHDREASGLHRLTVWLPKEITDHLAKAKRAGGFNNVGDIIAEAVRATSFYQAQQQKEDDQAEP